MQATSGMFIPHVPTELKPTIGMTFTSLDEALVSSIRPQATQSPDTFDLFNEHMKKFTAAVKALPTVPIMAPPITAIADDSSQPTVAAGDNFNAVGDEFINVVVHTLGSTSGIIPSQSSQACNGMINEIAHSFESHPQSMQQTIQLTLALLQGVGGEVEEGSTRMSSSSTGSRGQRVRRPFCFCGEPAIMLVSNTSRNPDRPFFRCSHYKDAKRDCTFFGWYDEWGESVSAHGIDQPHDVHSHTQRTDEMSPAFMELVRSVEALKISHRAETSQTRQMHKALAETVLRMDMDAARFVIHITLSKSIESYYHESGRAGRDNQLAMCVALYQKKDFGRVAETRSSLQPSLAIRTSLIS
ncbi:hypothetical protein ACLOJK_020878 [Asimina triloba]